MNQLVLPFVNWGYGIVLIGIFAAVCILLVVVVLSLMNGDKKAKEEKS